MYRLVVSELAHKDLDNIVAYIAVQLASPVAAANFLDEVRKCYDYCVVPRPNSFLVLTHFAQHLSYNALHVQHH